MSFLQKSAVGVSIADHAVEVVKLTNDGKVKIASRGRVALPTGVVVRGKLEDAARFGAALKEAFLKATPSAISLQEIVCGIPEEQTFLYVFESATRPTDEAILRAARENIPLPADDLLYAWRALPMKDGRVRVVIMAASKQVLAVWARVLESIGLEVSAFDGEVFAIFRNVFNVPPPRPVVVLDIGGMTTAISIFDEYGLVSTRSQKIAGDFFTREVAAALKVPYEKAEEEKRTLGILAKDQAPFFPLIKALEVIMREVRSARENYRRTSARDIGEIVLIGGSSAMPGLGDYIGTNFELPVRVGGSSSASIEAAGFALRALETSWDARDPAIVLTEEGRAGGRFSVDNLLHGFFRSRV